MIMSMHVPRGSINDELTAVCASIAEDGLSVCLPKLFLKLGLETIRRIEKVHHLVIEPLIGIDLARAACISAGKEPGGGIAQLNHIIAALPAAISKNTSPPPALDIAEAVSLTMPNSARFLQSEIPGCDFSILLQKILTRCGQRVKIEAEHINNALLNDCNIPELAVLSGWVMENEKMYAFRSHEVIAEYLTAYQEGIACELQARGRGIKK